MINQDFFRGKKAVVVGLARSGVSCANLLFELGADVSVTDMQDNESVRLNAGKLESKDIKLELGKHTRDFISGNDFIIVSPGVPGDSLPIIWAKQFGITLLSEIEIGWILCPADIIAVTGSSGKTTVTTLIGKIIEANGRRPFVCGNIGKPFCGELSKITADDLVVLEVSSFQLETIERFKPKISVFLNFSRNHLDRYNNMEEYLAAKKRIFMNQDESDYVVLNKKDPITEKISSEVNTKVVYFEDDETLNPNQAAVVAVGVILGIDRQVCMNVFRDFKGIEHRMEYVTQIKGIDFINDSKATTVESGIWALNSISKRVILIAGGKDKGVDYSLILGTASSKVKTAILIGESKQKIKRYFEDIFPVEEAVTMEEAVYKAFMKAAEGDCVLLSPLCSSFDMFSSYEERGRIFKNAVWELSEKITIMNKLNG